MKDGRTLSAETIKKLKSARTLRMKADECKQQSDDCEKQARAIEDELVGEWPDGESDPGDGPMGEPNNDPPADTPEDPDEVKAFKAAIKLFIKETTK
jgi:hypothetical protein